MSSPCRALSSIMRTIEYLQSHKTSRRIFHTYSRNKLIIGTRKYGALHANLITMYHKINLKSHRKKQRALGSVGLVGGPASGVSPLLPLLALDRVIQFACFTALGGESLQVALLPGLHTPGTSRVLSHELPGLGDRREPSARASWGGTIWGTGVNPDWPSRCWVSRVVFLCGFVPWFCEGPPRTTGLHPKRLQLSSPKLRPRS